MAAKAAHGVWAMTPTPNGSLTIRITPGTARAAASSTSTGALSSTGARRIAPYIIPGTSTSMLYRAVPSILPGRSTRMTSLPMSRNASGFFSSSGLISGAFAGISAQAAIAP